MAERGDSRQNPQKSRGRKAEKADGIGPRAAFPQAPRDGAALIYIINSKGRRPERGDGHTAQLEKLF